MTLENKSDVFFGDDETKPCKGAWLVLNYHHDGESHWCSVEQVKQRLVTIRTVKPCSERPARLSALGFVRWTPMVESARKAYEGAAESAWKAYEEAEASASKAYEEAEASARKAYEEAVAPARKAYEEAVAPARKAYEEAVPPARKEFLSTVDALTVEEWELETSEARK